ncbi:L-glutaminase [Pseudarcicella hirudinis]|uniref:Glutaminase n=1 Tax=Pseudarcicella hirudinis TaxID=1079859 RepID=A0A1I5SQ89_9BACT|nr:glutaminase [Pseudarcicella hirudinis]SFP72848.1 L-glutaminase [Pseudarcicella hirudinis]
MCLLEQINYQLILSDIYEEIANIDYEGNVANYIPQLAKVNPEKFGIHLCCLNEGNYAMGDSNEKFSIQSISKVLSLTLAFSMMGDKLWERVGVEPSGNPFNSLIQLETENGIPRNPLINSGALVISDILVSNLVNPKADYLSFIRKISGSDEIQYNTAVANSEKETGFRNTALINFMKSFGNIKNDPETVLDFYFHLCSIEMTCKELARTFLLFANHGTLTGTGECIVSRSQSKRVNAIMQTCGFYDEAGEFSFKVGLPGKSGVGGGIVAIHPDKYSIAVWSPKLNKKGNSTKGMKTLELLTTRTELSIF